MNNQTKRLFIGIKVSPKVKSVVSLLRTTVKSESGDIRWIYGNNLHLTLSFLGDVAEDKISELIKEIEQVIDYSAFKMSIEGTGIFPNEKSLRILWFGIKKGREEIINLQQIIDKSVVDYKQSRRLDNFRPHITIARVKRNAKLWKINVKNFLNSLYAPIEFNVNSVVLYESELRPEGAHYTKFKEFHLTERS